MTLVLQKNLLGDAHHGGPGVKEDMRRGDDVARRSVMLAAGISVLALPAAAAASSHGETITTSSSLEAEVSDDQDAAMTVTFFEPEA
jgi:hypothetical protein